MENDNYILSLESSSDTLGIALSKNFDINVSINYFVKNLHDRLLAELVRRILADLNLKISNLSAVAVSSGPGSFTGLRISSAFAKGLCFGDDIKLIAVPNLSAFSFHAQSIAKILGKSSILAAVHSHKNIIYTQKFNTSDLNAAEIEISDIEDAKKNDYSDSLIVGTAASSLTNFRLNPDLYQNRSELIANYAHKLFADGLFVDVESYEPNYIQDFTPLTSSKSLSI